MFSLRLNGLAPAEDPGCHEQICRNNTLLEGRIMGRPSLREEEKRKVQVNIRLTDPEHEKLKSYAEGTGITPANWIRQKVFAGRFPVMKTSPLNAAFYRELQRIGVNLNQAVKQMHQLRSGTIEPAVLTELLSLQKEIIRALLS
ncbi:plasmid mobilization relaxosome protein MobC [Mucilaginibacter sp. 21P]|uniref:plasmid mobilization protein n=1 Tax=Mucilaginibacter sp. 21P TaxID=2778902 RepID=UPI001C564D8E|nr:plasmid mobilization relaxosome protein MobC [Mucilaginibacter sp. 21P]QXV65570.1 plasmid mobilization relaxosome protein MobC [Mucilaginibacter sp. 21P]